MFRTVICFIFIGIVLSTPSIARNRNNLATAEKYFNQRGEGIEKIHEGKKIYLNLIKNSYQDLATRRIALDRYTRLTVLEAELGKQQFKIKNAAKIFNTCLETTDYLSPENIGEILPEYVYWRAICLGLWGANASITKLVWHMGRINELKELVKFGSEHFRTFDSYGFNRILAGMYIRTKALTILNLYHPEKSLELIEEALTNGSDLYFDYLLKAEALEALGRTYEAIELLERSIEELKQRLDNNTLPPLVKEENQYFLVMMMQTLELWL